MITLFLIFHLSILTPTIVDAAETETHLHFYFHDIISGTVVCVAKASTTSKSSSGFGATIRMDDLLTTEPNPSSTLIGRAQGIYALTSCDEAGNLMMTMNLVFLDKENNGSTLAILGHNSVFDTIREMWVIGGSEKFWYARGFIHAKTHTIDLTTGNAVVEYNVTVFHQTEASN